MFLQAVTFNECSNLGVAGLQIKDAQQMHLTFQKCVNVKAFNLFVTAPGNSPNTDGIHVTETQNINIENCVIRTGSLPIKLVYQIKQYLNQSRTSKYHKFYADHFILCNI